VDWINLAQDEDKWWTVVNVVMGSIKVAKFLDYLSTCQLIRMASLHDIWDKTFTKTQYLKLGQQHNCIPKQFVHFMSGDL